MALAAGATLLHLRIHPPKDLTFFWPNLLAWIDLGLVSALFLFRATALMALLLNSFLAFIGIIMMADFSIIATLTGQIKQAPSQDFAGWLLATTFPDILVLLADFLTGLALYRVIMAEK